MISEFLRNVLDYKNIVKAKHTHPPKVQREFIPDMRYTKKKGNISILQSFYKNQDSISLDAYYTKYFGINLETLIFEKKGEFKSENYKVELTFNQEDPSFIPIITTNTGCMTNNINDKVKNKKGYNLVMLTYELLYRSDNNSGPSKAYSKFKSLLNKAKAL